MPVANIWETRAVISQNEVSMETGTFSVAKLEKATQ